MAPKVDSLTTVSNTRPLTLNTKSINNNSIEVFTSDSIRANVDEVNISNQNNNSQIAENTDNKRKWLIGLGIAGSIAIGVGAAVLLKKLPKGICKAKPQFSRWENPNCDYRVNVTSTSQQIPMHHHINGSNSAIRSTYKDLTLRNCDELERVYRKYNIPLMQCTDEAFSKLPPLEKDCIVYRVRIQQSSKSRNVDFDIIENAKIGDRIIPDTGYSYCGIDKSLAEYWGNTCLIDRKTIMYTIRLPMGAKVSRNLEHGEYGGEILMPRNAEYKVVSKTLNGNHTDVTLEYILPQKDNLQEANELMAKFNLEKEKYTPEEILERFS